LERRERRRADGASAPIPEATAASWRSPSPPVGWPGSVWHSRERSDRGDLGRSAGRPARARGDAGRLL